VLLQGTNAVIFAAGGAVGSQTARVLAREGARVFLSGRRLSSITDLAAEIRHSGGEAEAAQVDACDEKAVHDYLDDVVNRAGTVDVHVNAIGIMPAGYGQGTPLIDLPVDTYMRAMQTFLRSQYLTAQATGRVMRHQGAGVIITLSTSAGGINGGLLGGLPAASAAVDAFMRTLASELGAYGVRVVGLRPGGMPDTPTLQAAYAIQGNARGMTPEDVSRFVASQTVMNRQPTTTETAEMIAVLASRRASALAATVVNLSLGEVFG
jgi:NAD(P)-dependent dehydrogenase (short-subunit alcohol dehydrogenase family)